MKKWNTPVVEELNITETANGIFPALFESCLTDNILDCGNRGDSNKGDNEQTPANPEEIFS